MDGGLMTGRTISGVSLTPIISREIRMVSRARGVPTLGDFEVVSTKLSRLHPGQMLVRNIYMAVDSYMRARINGAGSLIPAFKLGEPLEGSAVGEVVASAVHGFAPGDAVTSMCGWREYFVASPGSVRRVDPRIQPLSAYLGVLGSTGLTAWAGLSLAEVRPSEHVFIAAAASAVGSVTGQLAKLGGCHVTGSANSVEAAGMLVRELGFDAVFSDTPAELHRELKAAVPDGVDVYIDAGGGAPFEVVLAAMRPRGRIVISGAISRFTEPPQLRHARSRQLFITKRLTMKGFLVSDWLSLAPLFQKVVGEHLMAGRLRVKETIVDGIEQAPRAFIELLSTESIGRTLVQLS
jgi:NADPH-dependent curcumin reductase CurA